MPIHTTITPTSMTELQARVFRMLNTEENLHFSPREPLPQRQPPFFVPTLKDVQDIVDRLNKAGGAPMPIYMRDAPRVLNRMDISVRTNPDAMLAIIKADAYALTFVDKSIATPEFFAKAMEINPTAYDLLPYDLQQNPQIVERYGKGLLREPQLPFRECPRIHPNCPMDIMARTEVYKECVKEALLGKSISTPLPVRFDDPAVYRHGPAIALMGIMRDAAPELDYHAKNKEAFDEIKDELVKTAMPARVNRTAEYRATCIRQLAEREDLGTFMQDYEKAGWHNYCKSLVEQVTLENFGYTMRELTQYCPRDIAEQYFDVEKKQCLPNHPIWEEVAKSAESIKEVASGDLFTSYLEDILKQNAAHLYEPFIDLEAAIQEVAADYERAKRGELSHPVTHCSDYSYYSKSPAEDIRMTENRGARLLSMLERYPQHKQIFEAECARRAEMRTHYTPEQHEMRRMQQNMFANPRGLLALDNYAAQVASRLSPTEYQPYVDIKGYIERRTDWAVQASKQRENEPEIKAFKNMLHRTPTLQQIAENKLMALGVKDPTQWLATAESKFTYSMDKAPTFSARESQEHSQKFERSEWGQEPEERNERDTRQ